MTEDETRDAARFAAKEAPMTDDTQYTPPPPPGGFADEPIPETGSTADDAGTGGFTDTGSGASAPGGASAKSREWLTQLEAMINDIATQAAPVAKQIAAKAAELTAVAAVKAGPLAQKAAEVTNDAGQKLADRAQTLAAELRGDAPGTPVEDVPWSDGSTSSTTSDATGAAPEATFEDATDSATSTAGASFDDATSSGDEQAGSSI